VTARLRGDAGQVAGIEAVPFGLLVLLVGLLVIAHTWAVVDAKFMATSAAREAARTYVEGSAAGPAARDAFASVADVERGAGHRLRLQVVGPGFERCRLARLRATTTVPTLGVPWRRDRPALTVSAEHREIIDPYRDGLPGLASCEAAP
jgi:hypothetical protein